MSTTLPSPYRGHRGRDGRVRSLTDWERPMLRADTDAVVVVASHGTATKLHLPGTGEAAALCDLHGNGVPTRDKPLETFPPGYRPWCDYCVVRWRRGEFDGGQE